LHSMPYSALLESGTEHLLQLALNQCRPVSLYIVPCMVTCLLSLGKYMSFLDKFWIKCFSVNVTLTALTDITIYAPVPLEWLKQHRI
jgi:hypothetical protein